MNLRAHPYGCTCQTHVDRPWRRSEHWTKSEVAYLESHWGLLPDAAIVRRLGRSILGIRLKAKRLGLRKRAQGFSARDVAAIFGIDASEVGKVWVRRGYLASRRPFRQGPHPIHVIDPRDVERFIREHPEMFDVEKMPDSPYRDIAEQDPWISLPEAHRRTGRNPHAIARLIRDGVVRGRKRGTHWYMPAADLSLVPPLRSRDEIEESWFRRQSNLEARRARRKGIRRAA